jgi:predicted nucleic acid binding AN1-type Zn finger protein
MSSVVISPKGDNYPGNNKSETNTNESLHCTNQGPEDRIPRNDRMKYNTDRSLHCTNLGPDDRIPNESLHCTNQGLRGPHLEK